MSVRVQSFVWIALGSIVGAIVFRTAMPIHAYPEYTDRTQQQCTTCHVSPAGGGPRTLRGLLWIADGRLDEVPPLPGDDTSSAETALDGPTLYNHFECNRCHGDAGEGGVAAALNQTPWTAEQLAEIIRNGVDSMNGYPSQAMSDEELQALIPHVQAIGRGEVQSSIVLYQRPLPPPRLSCEAETADDLSVSSCAGN